MSKRQIPGREMQTWAQGRGFPILHLVFELGIIIKGFNALVELISGSILLFFSLDKLRSIITLIAGEDKGSWLRRHWALIFYRLDHWLAPDTKVFFTWFFLSHGAVKAFIIVCLFFGWVWAYPLGIAVFSAFIVYQIIEIIGGHHSILYFVLTVLDIFVIFLTVNEWRHAKLSNKNPGPRGNGATPGLD
jgi:uncharacterized membrane protein